MARAVSGPAVGCDTGIRPKALAQRSVLQIRAVAARSAIWIGPRRGAPARPEHWTLSRPSARHRSLRRRSLGAPFLLCFRIPRRLTPGWLLAQGPGLGLPASECRTALSRR